MPRFMEGCSIPTFVVFMSQCFVQLKCKIYTNLHRLQFQTTKKMSIHSEIIHATILLACIIAFACKCGNDLFTVLEYFQAALPRLNGLL